MKKEKDFYMKDIGLRNMNSGKINYVEDVRFVLRCNRHARSGAIPCPKCTRQ